MRRLFVILLWLLLAASAVGAVENSSQAFTILRAEQKTRDRVVYWVVDTPLYHEDPYFEVEVRAGEIILVGEYEPRHAAVGEGPQGTIFLFKFKHPCGPLHDELEHLDIDRFVAVVRVQRWKRRSNLRRTRLSCTAETMRPWICWSST